jgi:hypothetical protein
MALNPAEPSRLREMSPSCFAVADCSGYRERNGEALAAHLRWKSPEERVGIPTAMEVTRRTWMWIVQRGYTLLCIFRVPAIQVPADNTHENAGISSAG